MIDKEFIQNLTPVEIEFIAGYIYSLTKEKINKEINNHENMVKEVKCCPYCGSTKFVKYGFNKKQIQRFHCKDCSKNFVSTTGTIFYRSRLSFNDWTSFIAAELNGLTLEQEAVIIGKSITTCFYMRHKLYRAISNLVDSQILYEEVETDCTYLKINLKGTKPINMPRRSKQRGKSDQHNSTIGVSKRKICVFTAKDSNDNIINKIAGLGSETFEMIKPFSKYIKKNSCIISDSKASNILLAKACRCKAELVPTKKHSTKNGRNIAEINQIHSDIKLLNKKKHGISTRHLPDYLNWYTFTKKLKYQIELKRRKTQAYVDIMKSDNELTNKEICTIPMPIDLFEAYGDYSYGIFACEN